MLVENGAGQADIVARINFMSLGGNVTKVELTDVACQAVGANAS